MIKFNQKETITKESEIDLTDSRIVGVVTKNDKVFITYEEEFEEAFEINRWTVVVTLDQFAFSTSEVRGRPRSSKELAAIHAKKREDNTKSDVVTSPEPVVDISIVKPLSEKTILPTEEAEPINWKDRTVEKEERKAKWSIQGRDEKAKQILDSVFKWHSKNDYSKWNQKNHNLGHLLKKLLPNQFGLPFSTCRRIYLAQTYPEVTAAYKSLWNKLVKKLDSQGYNNAVPDYIRKHYSGKND
tara:strand:+ start:4808 stop:5533 length:726 start_codon:yes stop_codon:yes gene_type:complete